MRRIDVASLTGPWLDYYTGRADGIPASELAVQPVPRTTDSICVRRNISGTTSMRRWAPSTDWSHFGPLMFKHKLCMTPLESTDEWSARPPNGQSRYADDPREAGCRALVRREFGHYVEVPV